MKTILILRHAKSDWGDPKLKDFDRPLNKRGRKDAPRMGEALAFAKLTPDRILASPAKRAKQTAEFVAEACGYVKPIHWQESFYEAASDDLLTALHELPDWVERVLLVGHNPTLEETIAKLCLADSSVMGISMAPASLACLEADIDDWAELQFGLATLRWLLTPKLVKALV